MEKRFVAPESARRTVRAAKERTGLASVRNLILLACCWPRAPCSSSSSPPTSRS